MVRTTMIMIGDGDVSEISMFPGIVNQEEQ